jgi:hypothetical protein
MLAVNIYCLKIPEICPTLLWTRVQQFHSIKTLQQTPSNKPKNTNTIESRKWKSRPFV